MYLSLNPQQAASPILESLHLLNDVVDLALIEIRAVVAAQKDVVQFLVVQVAHQLAPHALARRGRPVPDLLLELADDILLLDVEFLMLAFEVH